MTTDTPSTPPPTEPPAPQMPAPEDPPTVEAESLVEQEPEQEPEPEKRVSDDVLVSVSEPFYVQSWTSGDGSVTIDRSGVRVPRGDVDALVAAAGSAGTLLKVDA